jgi:hypothetical protein
MAISSDYTDLLLKKYLGVVETSLSNTFASEAAGNARPNVFTNQLYNSPIPNTAPSGPLSLNSPLTTITITSPSPDLLLTGYVSSSGSITSTPPSNISFSTFTITPGVVYTSKTYPYIQYIQHLPLSSSGLSAGTSYRYTDPTSGTNILQNMIPFNYDPAQSSFKNYLYTGNGNNYINTKTNLIDQKYYLIDCDAGYLMFTNGDYNEASTGSSPLISFYRYNGAIGIPTNLGSFAGAYNQNVNALAYGSGAGQYAQGTGSIAIGFQAGQYSQGTGTIGAALAIGYQAGVTGQNTNTVAVGFQAGNLNQGTGSIAVGYQAGSIVPSSVSGSTGSAYLTSGNFPLSLSMYSANTFSSSNTIQANNLPLSGNITNSFLLSNTSVVPGMITSNIGTSTETTNIVLQNASSTIIVNTTTKTATLNCTFTYPSKIVMSSNGQYQLGSIGNTVYLSTNSGVTFRSTTLSTTNLWTSIAMSGNGQYMIAYSINSVGTTTTGSISSNYGSSWSPINTNAGLGISSVAISYTGQYIITVGGFVTSTLTNFVNVSSNFGSTFSRSTLPSSRWVTCSMSSSGQYMLVGSATTMYLSSNFGITFSIISSLPALVGVPNRIPPGSTTTPVCWYTSYVSGNAQCMIAVTSTYVYYISTNYGATWVPGAFTIETISSQLPYFISLTNTSQFLVAINPILSKSTIYLSPSYKTLPTTTFDFGGTGNSGTGKTIQLLSLPSTSTITSTAISSDGTYLTLATTTGFYTVNMNSAGNSVALGYQTGQINQAINTVAIGSFAGQTNQHANTIVLNASGSGLNTSTNGGLFAAPINPSSLATSAGVGLLGYSSSDSQIVTLPAMFDSSSDIITLGNYAGSVTGTTNNSIILNASGTGVGGNGPTGGFYVAPIGSSIGSTGPFTLLAYGADRQIVSITGTALKGLGIEAGNSINSIALGFQAGQINQSVNTVAIGSFAGQINQHANTIVLNASGTGLNTSTNGGLFAAPINSSSLATSTSIGLLGYSSSDSQIVSVPAMFNSSSDIITLGNYATGTTKNSIILNASGTGVGGNGPTGGFYVAPIGSSSGSTGPFSLLAYGADRQIVSITGTALTALGIGGGGNTFNNVISLVGASNLNFEQTTNNQLIQLPYLSTQSYVRLISNLGGDNFMVFMSSAPTAQFPRVASVTFGTQVIFGNTVSFGVNTTSNDGVSMHMLAGGSNVGNFVLSDNYGTTLQTATPTTSWGRYFATSGQVFQDFFGGFEWRGTNTLGATTWSTVTSVAKLRVAQMGYRFGSMFDFASVGGWDDSNSLFVSTGGLGGNNNGVGMGFNTTLNSGLLVSIAPNVSWRQMTYKALSHSFLVGISGSTSGLVIASNGRVGVGVTNPGSNLSVTTDIGIMSGTVAYLRLVADSGSGSVGAANYIQSSSTINSGRVPLHFTGNLANGPSVTIDANGNLGVNTSTPSHRLDVNGDTRVTGSVIATSFAGSAVDKLFNNMGSNHNSITSFDATYPSYGFGFRFVQGGINGPGGQYDQYYTWYIGLGNDYPATGPGSYGAMFAVHRNSATPYLHVRYNESNSLGIWGKISAGYADNAGNAGYAINAGNTNSISSAVGGSYIWTGVNYFQTNNGGYAVNNSNTASLQAYSTGNNSAFMSFHRGGYYAINMGLDQDNVFRIGGWSAGASRLQLDMSGNLTMAGDITAFSDARVKENVKTIENALSKTLALRGVSYNRTDSEDKKTKIGVIAQEVLKVIPEVVNQDNDGMYNVSYGNLGGLFIEAIKEQQAQIDELKKENVSLRQKVNETNDLLHQLINKLDIQI